MTITDDVTFSLERFESLAGGGLRVGGAWNGIQRHTLAEPTLVIHGPGGQERIEPVEGILGSLRHWSATFPWVGDAAAIQRAELELGGGLVIELPSPPSAAGHRRFGRTRIPVREKEPVASASEGDLISLHTALVEARQQAAEASEALESAQVGAAAARDEARRERSRRQSEAIRLGEALDTLRRLAASSLDGERAVTQQLSAEVTELKDALTTEREQAGQLREEAAVSERLRAALDEAQQLSVHAAEQAKAEFERLRVMLTENQRTAEAYEAENARLSALAGDADRAAAECERLRRRLAAVRAVVEQQPPL